MRDEEYVSSLKTSKIQWTMTISKRELDLQMVGSPFSCLFSVICTLPETDNVDSEFSLENRPKLHQKEMKSFERTIEFSVV